MTPLERFNKLAPVGTIVEYYPTGSRADAPKRGKVAAPARDLDDAGAVVWIEDEPNPVPITHATPVCPRCGKPTPVPACANCGKTMPWERRRPMTLQSTAPTARERWESELRAKGKKVPE